MFPVPFGLQKTCTKNLRRWRSRTAFRSTTLCCNAAAMPWTTWRTAANKGVRRRCTSHLSLPRCGRWHAKRDGWGHAGRRHSMAWCPSFFNPSSGAYAQDVFPSGKLRETHCVSYSSPPCAGEPTARNGGGQQVKRRKSTELIKMSQICMKALAEKTFDRMIYSYWRSLTISLN